MFPNKNRTGVTSLTLHPQLIHCVVDSVLHSSDGIRDQVSLPLCLISLALLDEEMVDLGWVQGHGHGLVGPRQ